MEITRNEGNRIRGNLYELDFRQCCKYVEDSVLPIDYVRAVYEHGSRKQPVTQSISGEDDPLFGKFLYTECRTNDTDTQRHILWEEKRNRDPLKQGDFQKHLVSLQTGRIETEAKQQGNIKSSWKLDGQFWIVSGHRRKRANILNIERGHEEYKQVRYLYKDMTQSMLELSLLMGNAYNRELTAWEKTQQAKCLKEVLLRAKKEDRLEIQGKLRDVVARLMNESGSNIAKMECIDKHTVPEIQEEFKKGNLGISAAYEVSKLSPEEQKAVAKRAAGGSNIPVKEIAGKSTVKENGRNKSGLEEKTSEQKEEEKPLEKLSRTEKAFRHKKILREWEN